MYDLPYLAVIMVLMVGFISASYLLPRKWGLWAPAVAFVLLFVLLAVPALNYGHAKKNNLPFEPWGLPGAKT